MWRVRIANNVWLRLAGNAERGAKFGIRPFQSVTLLLNNNPLNPLNPLNLFFA